MGKKQTKEKLRGGYYTPTPIAEFLADFAIRTPKDVVAEPSCGDGVFLEPIHKRLLKLGSKNTEEQIYAVEIEETEFLKAHKKLTQLTQTKNTHLYKGDFFSLFGNKLKTFIS